MKNEHTNETNNKSSRTGRGTYNPLPFFVIRTPLLPIEDYFALSGIDADNLVDRAMHNPKVTKALAVGSPSLYNAFVHEVSDHTSSDKLHRKLLRYMIRMSSRPTPFGLCAGVALGKWDEQSNLKVKATGETTRTRLDVGSLTRLMLSTEKQVLKNLRFMANPAILDRANKFSLLQKSAGLDEEDIDGATIEATDEVRQILALARKPVSYEDLLAGINNIIELSREEIEEFVADLVANTFLLTNLRPHTADFNQSKLLSILADIEECKPLYDNLAGLTEAVRAMDAATTADGGAEYMKVAAQSDRVLETTPGSSLQTDMAVALEGETLGKNVATEIEKMIELAISLSSRNMQISYLQAYRQRFISTYSVREVPLLELLHHDFGLGFPWEQESTVQKSEESKQHQIILDDLLHDAIREGKMEVTLDDKQLEDLSSKSAGSAKYPLSLDIFVTVLAKSLRDLDDGNFMLTNFSFAPGAGRSLGRFADMLGAPAIEVLNHVDATEQSLYADRLFAELNSLPKKLRVANVSCAPALRPYQIGTDYSEDSEMIIDLSDIVVGVSDDRFYLRSISRGSEITVSAAHLGNSMMDMAISRFLREISNDRIVQLTPFDWGSAWNSTFLPRVRHNKLILSPAQWNIHVSPANAKDFGNEQKFSAWVKTWRKKWMVPQHVCIVDHDNLLLIDLDNPMQVEELRRELTAKDAKSVKLQEAFCESDQLWAEGPGGKYVSQLVVSYILNSEQAAVQSKSSSIPLKAFDPSTVSVEDRLRAPGSEWIYAKFYVGQRLQDELISTELLNLATDLKESELIQSWFFIRYTDPDPHIRFRVRLRDGRSAPCAPEEIEVHKKICDLGRQLIQSGSCNKFAIDTYDREIERYGGPQAIQTAEQLFAADSEAVAKLIALEAENEQDRLNVCAMTIDRLLESLGLSASERIDWYKKYAGARAEIGPKYRERKNELLVLFSRNQAELESILSSWSTSLQAIGKQYKLLEKSNSLLYSPAAIYRSVVHMHCNRFLGVDLKQEQHAIALASRALDTINSMHEMSRA